MYRFSFIMAVLAAALVSCGGAPKVTRVDTQADLSGYWNDNDVRQVCDNLIESCVASQIVERFISQYAQTHGGETPAAIVLPFKNASSEHIDTQIISGMLRSSIMNSGRLEFVEGGAARDAIRAERADQGSGNANPDTVAEAGNETGAALAFTGEVRSLIDEAGKNTARTYYVKATLTNMATNRILWEGEETVRKNIRRSVFKP